MHLEKRSEIWFTAAFLLLAPTLAHLLYSSFGFNPTDDGFILAGSRRILDGQVPHRDFISIRPAGSYLLHVPFVWLGGSYTFWLSRWFVWFELVMVAWLAVTTLQRLLRVEMSRILVVALSLLAAAFGVNQSPIMAWHSYDALFFSFLGFAAITRCRGNGRFVGYLLLGLAPLCRQNFLLAPLVALLLTGHWRQWRNWTAIIFPGALMVLTLLLLGALPRAWMQLASQTGLYEAGIEPFITDEPIRYGFLVGAGGALLLMLSRKWEGGGKRQTVLAIVGVLLLFLTPATAISYLAKGEFLWKSSIRLFGAALGSSLLLALWPHRRRSQFRITLLVLFLAWSASVSVGYQSTALAAGAVAALLVLTALVLVSDLEKREIATWVCFLLTVLILIPTLVGFDYTRRNHIYRERRASELSYPLGGVLSGGGLIYTNGATYELMTDLRRAIVQANGERYAILPDFACHWVRSTQSNPLPLDWVQSTELATPGLVSQVVRELEDRRGEVTVLIQKVSARNVATRLMSLPRSERYEVVNYVAANWTLSGETQYFNLYR